MPVENPTINHVKGSWESTTYGYYSIIKIKSENDGLLITVGDDESVTPYKLISFTPGEKDIEMIFKGINNKEKPFSIKVAVAKDSLTVTDVSEPKVMLSYIRSKKLLKYQEAAAKYIGGHK